MKLFERRAVEVLWYPLRLAERTCLRDGAAALLMLSPT
jgi:hypothetical protein